MAYPYDDEDKRAALTQGLLAAGLAALGARKGSEYNALGQAGLLGITGYNTSLRDATNAREQQAALKMRQEMYDMQKAQWEEQQRQARAQQAAAAGAFTGGMPEMGPPTPQGEMQPAVAPQYNPQAYIAALQANGLPQQAIAEAQKLKSKDKELSRVEELTFNGKPVSVAFYKDGSRELLPYNPKATEQWEDIPTPKGAAPGLQWQRSKTTGQLRSTGSQPAQTTINLGGPKWESSAGGFVVPPSADNPTGQVIVPAGMPPKEAKPLTEAQAKATAFVNQMQGANRVFEELQAKGFDGRNSSQQAAIVAAGTEGISYVPGSAAIPRAFAGSDAQKFYQGELQWTEAALRFMTGANAPDQEVKRNAATYFPRPGDSAAVIEQKAMARANMEESIRMAAGTSGQRTLDQRATPKAAASQSLPDPKALPNGAIVTDTQTGRKLKVVNGKYVTP